MKLQRNVRIKGKLWASVIKLSGATQSAASPFNLTSSDWGTNEKKKKGSGTAQDQRSQRGHSAVEQMSPSPPILNISSRAK